MGRQRRLRGAALDRRQAVDLHEPERSGRGGTSAEKTKIPADRILVAHDELDLALGTVRLKFSGGLAGHNGLKSVAAHLGTRDFARIRLGIGRPEGSEAMADYVLRSFMPAEWEQVAQALGIARDAVLHYCSEGLTAATSRLHSR